MSKLKNLITNLTRETFVEAPEHSTLSEIVGQRKQISLRPSVITLTKIDVLADILDVSRQMLVDDLIDQGIDDAIDAYCDAHGPAYRDKAYEEFKKKFLIRAVGHDGTGEAAQ